MNTIPIFFTFDNNYVVPAAVAFYSLINKADINTHYDMYVLHSDITEENQNLLKEISTRKNNAQLDFIDTKDFLKGEWNNGSFTTNYAGSNFTKDAIMRCFPAHFFPKYDKIIYSDVDIIFTDDISELFTINLDNKYIAGVKNPFMKYFPNELSHMKPEHYEKFKDSHFGGGIWVMNLKKIREDKLEEKMLEIAKDKTIIKRFNDQDIMNIACDNKVAYIPLNYISYPYMIDLLKKPDFVSHYTKEELYDSILNPKIIHFAAAKPWNDHPQYSNLWWTYFHYLNLPMTKIFTVQKQQAEYTKIEKKYKKYRKLFNIFTFLFILLAVIDIITLIILR